MTRARRPSCRRGQLQISFHFLFALIGGLLFLLFFFILIQSVLTQDEARERRGLAFRVEAILRTAAATPDTFTRTSLPEEEYRLVCEQDALGTFSYVRVGQGSVTDQHALDHIPLFAPPVVEGEELFTLTRSWEAPFPVGSLLYADNNRTRYVIVDTPAAVARGEPEAFIRRQNLAGFNIRPWSADRLADYPDEGFRRYRFLLLAGDPARIPASLPASALVVTPRGEGGLLAFHDRPGEAPTARNVAYYGEAMLLAALFSHDWQGYACNAAKAEGRLAHASLILQRRLDLLEPSPLPDDWDACEQAYAQARSLLAAYAAEPGTAYRDALDGRGPIAALEDLNRQLLGLQCPLLY